MEAHVVAEVRVECDNKRLCFVVRDTCLGAVGEDQCFLFDAKMHRVGAGPVTGDVIGRTAGFTQTAKGRGWLIGGVSEQTGTDGFERRGGLERTLAALARVTGRIVQLPANDTAEIERHLAALREAGVRVEDVEIRKADLEDVFIALMNGSAPAQKAPPALEAAP